MGGSICCLTFLMTMLVSTFIIQYVEACVCPQEHLQKKFCRSDFVARVKIDKLTEFQDGSSGYPVNSVMIYKATPQVRKALMLSLKLWTPSRCELLNLESKKTWLISGWMNRERPYINICSLVMRWSEIRKLKWRRLFKLYQKGCTCDIRRIITSSNETYYDSYHRPEECVFDDINGLSNCRKIHNVCTPKRDGSCSWKISDGYVQCDIDAALLKERSSSKIIRENIGGGLN